MPAVIRPFSITLSVIMLIVLWITGCGYQKTAEPTDAVTPTEAPIPKITQTNIPEPTNTLLPTESSSPLSTQVYSASSTPTPTIDSTYQVWHATAISQYATERAAYIQKKDEKATQIAQFYFGCDDLNVYQSDISPDGKWLAASCGYERNQTLIVQNRQGNKWVLEFNDFLSPDTELNGMGLLAPVFWSPEGKYLYFRTGLGYDGGGNQCFTRSAGNYGLFRLNLNTGSWVTLVPPRDNFPGYIIRFSPTGRHYAININGVIITDIQTGKITQLDTPGLTDFIWSPDGKYLAYTIASCGEEYVQSSAVYVWNVLTNQNQELLTADNIKLLPELWVDDITLRVIREKEAGRDTFYTVYEYNIEQNGLVFTGTATPYP